jgi:2'-5' RNA ligase
MRLFAAAELPEAVAAGLAGWARDAAGDDPALRLVGVGSLHLTLAFLGERPAEDVPGIAGALDAAVAAGRWPEGLAIGDVMWLAPRRPHVLTVALTDRGGALGALQERVASGLADAIGYEAEHRRFRPHVTVARVRRGGRPRLDLCGPQGTGTFALEAVTLMRSHLGGRGPARYEALHRISGQ